MRIKICGITNRDDALCAVDAGADALGFVFVKSSPRCVSPVRAAEIIAALPKSVLTVGVFVNGLREEMLRTMRATGLGALQLHGQELPAAALGYDIPVIKAHRVKAGFNPEVMRGYQVYAHLVDAWVEGKHGGTGHTCDWEIASRAARVHRTILSGGLRPENVGAAIRAVKPFAVDVSSGVEKQPGLKDHNCVRSFVTAARGAFERMNFTEWS